MIAHVLSGTVVPIGVEWAAAVALFGGAFAALAVRRRSRRVAFIVSSAVGLALTTVAWVADAAQPGPAPYGVRIVAPGRVTAPDAVFTVCGVRGDGSLLMPTDAQHWLAPFVDGRQRPVVDAPVYPVRLTPGTHTVRFDLVTPSMREFAPPASAATTVLVSAAASPSGPARC